MKNLTTAALCAKQIRTELKATFPTTKFSVTSENFSMGDAVRIKWTDGATEEKINNIVRKYQYGSFNGMEDIYEHTNSRDDIYQAKFIGTHREYSEETRKRGEEIIKNKFIKDDSESWEEFSNKMGACGFNNLVWKEYLNKTNFEIKEEKKIIKSTLKIEGVEIVDYSEKALAVFGNTKAVKDRLKSLGGRFNPFLKREGEKMAGWIFKKESRGDLLELLKL